MENWKEAIKVLESTIEELHDRDRKRNVPAKILLVDDDDNDIVILHSLLDTFYTDVYTCRTSNEAQTLLGKHKFDFAFLDQKMPMLSGIEILKQTMPQHDGTQFFIVSGFQDSVLVNETLKLGALYIPKPVTRKLLSTFLREKQPA